jgi:2-iminobutanoate/2-iminopropanoate deaminase
VASRGLSWSFTGHHVRSNPVSKGVCHEQDRCYSPELTPPVGPFSQAIEVGGFLYFSGQVGQDQATGKVVEGGIVAETERVFQNLSAVLKAAGKSFDHVACARVFLTNMSDYVAMNGVYAKYFGPPFPARTTIAAAALLLGACVEIDLVVKG